LKKKKKKLLLVVIVGQPVKNGASLEMLIYLILRSVCWNSIFLFRRKREEKIRKNKNH